MMPFLITTALLAAQAPVASRDSEDSLHYSLGGIMSSPVDLTLSLVSGRFLLKEGGGHDFSSTPEEHQTGGNLNAEQVSRLRVLAFAALKKGLETEACKRSRAKGDLSVSMPIMDALSAMTVKLKGRLAIAPVNAGCWSTAADDLAGAALAAAKSASH